MIQATGSNAGKSTLVAGLARALVRRGLKVAPFKPQNMSNNAAIAVDGGEIGRAQAVQARAARVPPSVHMNPVLLKPETDTGAQVILRGQRIGTLRAQELSRQESRAVAAGAGEFCASRPRCRYRSGGRRGKSGRDQPARRRHRQYGICRCRRRAGHARRRYRPRRRHREPRRHPCRASADERARIHGFLINKFRGDAEPVRLRARHDRRA